MHECNYEELSRKALLDVELFARTTRVRTPSPAASSNSSDENLHSKELEDIRLGGEEDRRPPAVQVEKGLDSVVAEVPVILLSDSEDDFCRCGEEAEHGGQEFLAVTSSYSSSAATDSDFHTSNCESDSDSGSSAATDFDFCTSNCESESDSGSSATSTQGVQTEMEEDLHIEMEEDLREPSNAQTSGAIPSRLWSVERRRTRATAFAEYQHTKAKQVSASWTTFFLQTQMERQVL